MKLNARFRAAVPEKIHSFNAQLSSQLRAQVNVENRALSPIFGVHLSVIFRDSIAAIHLAHNLIVEIAFHTHGGERSRLWLLRQGKRAEEARMISLTNNLCKK